MKVQIDICMELELAGTFEDFENEVMLALEGRGGYGMTGGIISVIVDQDDIEEVSMRLVNIAGLKISKVYIDNVDIEEDTEKEISPQMIVDALEDAKKYII